MIDASSLQLIQTIDCHARIYSSPRLIDGNVVFGTNGGSIFEINSETLDIIAVAHLPDAVTNAISCNDDASILYASTHMNELYAIKRERVR